MGNNLNFNHIQLSGLACPSQKLTILTYPQSNMSDITNHAKLMIESSDDVVYPIAIGSKGKQQYTAIFNVIGIEGLVDALNVTFSELDFFIAAMCTCILMYTHIYSTFRHICCSTL